MHFSILLFIPFVISQPCLPSIRPLGNQNVPSLSTPCLNSRPLIPYVSRPSFKVTYLRSKIMDDDIQEEEDIEYVNID